ncbi:unnamed protein product [Lampetra planeri]
MELLEAFYRRKLRRKQRKPEPGRSDVAVVGRTQGALARTPSEASVSGLATGLISKVLRFTSRRNEPASRPHSWHSTKISDGERAPERRRMDTMGSGWQQGHHSSASTSDLSGGFESSSGYLRKSPDQYSSRGSMESLDPPPSAQLRPREQQYHPLVHSGHGGAHPAYSSCQQLSSARSSSSIDHLHSKRDSAYSSFSTSSSIPEYLAVPSSSPERSCSLEDVLHQGGGREEMQQADIRHVQTACGAPGLEPGSTPSSSSRRSRELQGPCRKALCRPLVVRCSQVHPLPHSQSRTVRLSPQEQLRLRQQATGGEKTDSRQLHRWSTAPQTALQWEQKEQRQHPLTRLEIALAEMAEKGRSAPCGAEDIRNMLERSTSGSKAHRALSFRGGSSTQLRTSADPSSALQRSRSSLHLEESREGDNRRDVLLRQDLQEMLGSLQDPSLSRSYKDSLKGVQSRVLRSTSFKRRDLLTSSPSFSSISSSDPPKPHPLEKKAPKTMPKPQGVMLPLTSPHAPRERHVISPQVRGPSPPALPSVPAVGPPALLRICGRKRLTADQKKRSYSEPENINEVGVSDAETTALLRPGGGEHMNVRPTDSTLLSDRRSTPRPSETSVADRRRMFEAVTRPDLRQLQHNALTEYVERKRGGGRDEGGRRTGPPAAQRLPAAGRCPPPSLSSTSSLLSLQYSSSDQSLSSGERRHCSTRPPGDDPWNHQSNLFYPGRVTTPAAAGGAAAAEVGLEHMSGFSFLQHVFSLTQKVFPVLRLEQEKQSITSDQFTLTDQSSSASSSQQCCGAPGSGAAGGGAAAPPGGAAADQWNPTDIRVDSQLLEVSFCRESAGANEPAACPRLPLFLHQGQTQPGEHARTHTISLDQSSPEPKFLCQFSCVRDTVPSSDRPRSVSRFVPAHDLIDLFVPHLTCPSFCSASGPAHSAVTHRRRQRNSERQRAHSTSSLAASVGLPCPLGGGGIRDGGDPAPSSKRGAHVSFDEDLKDLDSTKVALCEALRCSVVVLRAEREELQEEQQRHQALGASLDSVVQEHCRTNERDKYSRFIGDLEKVVNLLLSLCGRLSRIDTSLLVLQQQVDEDAAEERTEDAWELKENLDRRQRVVHAFLSDRLAAPHLQDYRRFVSTKPSLLIRQRNLDDLIRQMEEQLARLAENLPPELAEARGWSRSCLFSAPSPAPCSSPCPPLIPGPAHLVRSTTVTSL